MPLRAEHQSEADFSGQRPTGTSEGLSHGIQAEIIFFVLILRFSSYSLFCFKPETFREIGFRVRIGFIWLMIGTGAEIL